MNANAGTTSWVSIAFFLIAAVLGAVGQYLFKSGADAVRAGTAAWVWNNRIALGLLGYIGVMVLQLSAFHRGGSLTVLYPVYASTFIWAALIAWAAYGTPIRPVNVFGMLLLIAGMYCLGKQG